MTQVAAANTDGVTNAPRPRPPTPRTGFHVLLAELNPLQYVPVLGTIYRALTGDRIPEEARTVGSLVVSGILGGPAGVAISVAETAVEKMAGIDPEKLGTRMLASIGIGSAKPDVSPAAAPGRSPQEQAPDAPPAIRTAAWSPAQLAAYGVTSAQDGALKQGDLQDSDVLNSLEIARLARSDPPSRIAQTVTARAAPSV